MLDFRSMAPKVDLYTILRSYSNRTNNHQIPFDYFIRYLQSNSGGESISGQHIGEWASASREKIKAGLENLVKDKKIKIIEEVSGQQTIELLFFYVELLKSAYDNIDENSEIPLPDERYLGITIPTEQIKVISVENDLLDYLIKPQPSSIQILKLIFQNANGNVIMLNTHLPERILEVCIAKMTNSFRRHNTLDFFSQKLIAHFYGQETHVRNFMKTLMSSTEDTIETIIEGGDFSFSVWLFMSQVIKAYVEDQVERANDRKPSHIALAQVSLLIVTISNYYKVLAMQKKERIDHFEALEKHLMEPPYLYTIKDIYAYKISSSKTMMDVYGEKEITSFINGKLKSEDGQKLPEIIKYKSGGEDGGDWLVKKEKVIPLCSRLISESRNTILNEIQTRWMKLLRNYRSDPAMKFDDSFEETINKTVALFAHPLFVIARDKMTAVIQEETGPYPNNELMFNNYKPVPWRTLFAFKRETIFNVCRTNLPFWYSLPFLVKLIAFVKYGPKALVESKKKAPNLKNASPSAGVNQKKEQIKNAAQKIATGFLPKGETIATYMEALNERWNHSLNKAERDKITRDVNAIIKNHMTQALKIQSRSTIDEQIIDDTSNNIIDLNLSLKKIKNRNALQLYIKSYILQLLSDSKF
ncbi:MAG: hypothetical protein LBC53_04730 [Spirochaetaceae bacterium]|jgi:hypothetical protein|nr:hypothetical protein [Spirochaetaceae bacterium]